VLCPVQKACGGCPELAESIEVELSNKLELVNSILSINQVNYTVAKIHSLSRVNYRNRLRLRVENGVVKLFNQIKKDGCIVLEPKLWNAVQSLIEISVKQPDLLFDVNHLEVRVSDQEDIGLMLSDHPKKLSKILNLLGDSWLIGTPELTQVPRLKYSLGRHQQIEVPINSFVQINSEINELILEFLTQTLIEFDCNNFIDLFSGAGNYSIKLLAMGLKGIAVETNQSAISALKDSVYSKNLECISANVSESLKLLKPSDLVICNPPRAGLKTGYKTISGLANKLLFYVGCNPKTLASDLKELDKNGLSVKHIELFNMFPGTSHVETVAVLVPK